MGPCVFTAGKHQARRHTVKYGAEAGVAIKAHGPHTCARVHARARTPVHIRRERAYTAGKTAGENASGVKKSYARGADERALFTLKMADYARCRANVGAFTRVRQAERPVICPVALLKKECEHDRR